MNVSGKDNVYVQDDIVISNPRAQEAAATVAHESTVGSCRRNGKVQQDHCLFSNRAAIRTGLPFPCFAL